MSDRPNYGRKSKIRPNPIYRWAVYVGNKRLRIFSDRVAACMSYEFASHGRATIKVHKETIYDWEPK